MAQGDAAVIEGGRVVRINLAEPLVPGTRIVRGGVTFVVKGEGEYAEPLTRIDSLHYGESLRGQAALGTALAVGGLVALMWIFFRPTRG